MYPKDSSRGRASGLFVIGAVLVMAVQCSTTPARPEPERSTPIVEEDEPDRVEPHEPGRVQDVESPSQREEDEYRWGERNRRQGEVEFEWKEPAPRREDPTATAGGALTLFMRARNYRTIRILRSVMTPGLQTSFDRNSARFNGKQNVRLSAFHFQDEDLDPIRHAGARGARQPTIYDATVGSLWTDQGELAEKRVELIRLVQEENGLWRVGRLESVETNRKRFQEQIPCVTSLRKFLRAWHKRRPEDAIPYLSPALLGRYEGQEEKLREIFEGDPELRHAAFRIIGIVWEEDQPKATAHVAFNVTAKNRFGALDATMRRVSLTREGSRWYVDSWADLEESELEGL